MAKRRKVFWSITFGTREDGFLGAVVVEAPDLNAAVAIASELGQHPGGLELGIPFLTAGFDPAWTNRLLTREEFRNLPQPDDITSAWNAARDAGDQVQVTYAGDTMFGFTLDTEVAEYQRKIAELRSGIAAENLSPMQKDAMQGLTDVLDGALADIKAGRKTIAEVRDRFRNYQPPERDW